MGSGKGAEAGNILAFQCCVAGKEHGTWMIADCKEAVCFRCRDLAVS